jgi:hypothetical protein
MIMPNQIFYFNSLKKVPISFQATNYPNYYSQILPARLINHKPMEGLYMA